MPAIEELARVHELPFRLGFFLAVFALVALGELVFPRRKLSVPKLSRWLANMSLVLVNAMLLRLVFPAASVGMALLVEAEDWGLLRAAALPYAARFVLAVVALDLGMYLQHVMMHAVPLLWRLHRVHHADLDFDVTTGARFHPIEILLSMAIKLGAISVLGPPVASVVAFEVLLNATAMFNHGNLRLPAALDRALRWLLVTPDMHRVHHSTETDEANRNFGFNLPWWDRLFATYRAQPRNGHEKMTIGITTFREPERCVRLSGMLIMPFLGPIAGYPIGRRHPSITGP